MTATTKSPTAIQTDLLKQRLIDATTADNKWNFWPDKLEIVKLRLYDSINPEEMHALGYLQGTAKVMRQIRYGEFSHAKVGYDNDGDGASLVDVRQQMPRSKSPYGFRDDTLIHVDFTLAGARGQEDDSTKRNILAIFPAVEEYDSIFKRQRIVTHGLVVEIGCRHDYSDAGSNHTRGYHKGECRRCGHRWMQDSGD